MKFPGWPGKNKSSQEVRNYFPHSLEFFKNNTNFCNFMGIYTNFHQYCNDRKFLDRYAWANSADPDQTAPRGAV